MKYWTNESKSSYHLHLKENPTTFISENMHKPAFVKWFTKYCENIHELSIPQTMWNISQSLSLMTYNVPHGTLMTYNLHYRLLNGGHGLHRRHRTCEKIHKQHIHFHTQFFNDRVITPQHHPISQIQIHQSYPFTPKFYNAFVNPPKTTYFLSFKTEQTMK